MTFASHHVGNCQTYADAVAAWHCERSFKALHGTLLVSEQAQGLSYGNQHSAFLGLIGCRELRRLLCSLYINQCLLPILQLGIGTRELCVNSAVVGRKLLRKLQ